VGQLSSLVNMFNECIAVHCNVMSLQGAVDKTAGKSYVSS
jgi:hypothetical protein